MGVESTSTTGNKPVAELEATQECMPSTSKKRIADGVAGREDGVGAKQPRADGGDAATTSGGNISVPEAGAQGSTPSLHPVGGGTASAAAAAVPAAATAVLTAATPVVATVTRVGSLGRSGSLPAGISSSSAGAAGATHLAAAFSEDKGCRSTMEDVCVLQLDARPAGAPACRLAHFGVFDGHGGVSCALYASQQLHTRVLEGGLLRKGLLADGKTDAKACKASITEGFKSTDASLLKECGVKNWPDGACAVAVWVLQELVLVANVGDAKCVLARAPDPASAGSAQPPKQAAKQQPKAIVLTKEHTALLERQRIEKAGGTVVNGRLAGRIQISRSFGDVAFKKLGCSSMPDVMAFPLTGRDTFMLLGCDGFWGVFGAQEAVDVTAGLLAEGMEAKLVTNRLLNMAVREKKCKDNCSVLLIKFGA